MPSFPQIALCFPSLALRPQPLRLLAIHLPGEVHHRGQTLHKVYQLHGEVFDLVGPEGPCAQLRLDAIHLPGEVHHLGHTLHKVYQLHGEVFYLIKLSKMCVFGLKIRPFRRKKTKSTTIFQHCRYLILDVRYSILFDTVKSFEISGFDRYSIQYSQG